MKKELKSKTILLVSAITYWLALGFTNYGEEIIGSALSILGFITLLIGAYRYYREAKVEKGNK